MKKLIYTTSILAGFVSMSNAQQLPIFSQYYYNPFIYNPAFTGQGDKANAYVIHRSQWKDMPGAPVTYAITVDGPVWDNKVGLGVSMFSDQTDMFHRSGLYTSYSYKFKIAEDQFIVPGLSFGMIDNRVDMSRAIVKDNGDPFMVNSNRRKVTFDANFGVAYIWKELRIGISALQLVGNKIGFNNNDGTGIYQKLQQHYVFSAQYGVMISESAEVKALPSIMVRYTQGAPIGFDVNAIFEWKDMIRGGFSFRLNQAVGLTAGIKLNKSLIAGYTYELPISTVKSYSGGGGHEIMLGYSFGGSKGMDDTKMKELMSKIEAAQNRSDSLSNELKKRDLIHDEEIKKLKERQDSLANAQKDMGKNTNNTPNNNTNTTNTTTNNTTDPNNKLIRAESVTDYTDENGADITPGYYVIVESFRNVSNAKANKEFYEKQKQIKVMTIFNKKRKFYYNSVLYTTDEESAIDLTNEIKKEKPDSWIFKLME
ncbi:MAG TPA: type IX secretion system membrane protein PorP/SprF [Flavobacteriales bacterium]|nr:type IX secretion system membrane protein PorP/SprF [Flavobacteriales bacterium]